MSEIIVPGSPVKEDINSVNVARMEVTDWWLYYDYLQDDKTNLVNLINHSNQSEYSADNINVTNIKEWGGDASGRNTQGWVSIYADNNWTEWQHIKWRRADLEWLRDRMGNYLWIPYGTSKSQVKKKMAEYYNIHVDSVIWYIPSLAYPGNHTVWIYAKDSSTMFSGYAPYILSYW